MNAAVKFVVVTAALWQTLALGADDSRFAAVEVYLDSQEPVAAWQFEFSNRHGGMQVVGVENGDSAAFAGTPYYDREAVRLGTADRVVVADYSLAPAPELPSGRVRIATLHLVLDATVEPTFALDLVTAVDVDGRPVKASLELRPITGSES